MNVYVLIKQVPDTETKIKLKADNSGIDDSAVKWILSPYDEFAVEEALQFKQKNSAATVTAVSVGPARVDNTIRTALAMGCDQAVRIDAPETIDNFLVAKALGEFLKKQSPQIVFSGKEAIDDGAAQVSQMAGEFAGIPCLTVIQKIDYADGKITCHREVEGGAIEVTETSLPAIIAASKGLNEPRYASLPNIMKAKKKEIKVVTLADLGVSESDQKTKYKNYELPPPKQAGKKIEGEPEAQAKELVRLLREEAKVV